MIMFVVHATLLRYHNFGHCFSRLHFTIFGRAYVDFVLNCYIAMSANPCAKNVLKMFEAHFLEKKRKLSLDK